MILVGGKSWYLVVESKQQGLTLVGESNKELMVGEAAGNNNGWKKQ
jgi:hypothetical protein